MTATCALAGCSEPVRNAQAMYCSEAHKRVVRAQRLRSVRRRERANTPPKKRGRPYAAEGAQEAASRQRPPERTYKLRIDRRVVIRPPVDVVRQPAPLPFTDDLNAVLDHGSPGKTAAPYPRGYAQQWAGD